MLAEENFEGYVDLNELFGRGDGTFLLKVRGESMIGAGINDGDIVVVRNQERVVSGEIGVAVVGGEATVKRLFHEEGTWRLQPENTGRGGLLVTGSTSEGEHFTYNQKGSGSVEESCVAANLLRWIDSLIGWRAICGMGM